MIKVEEIDGGRVKVIDDYRNETYELPYNVFWAICRAGDRIDTMYEVKEFIQENLEDLSLDEKNILLLSKDVLDAVVDKTVRYRINNESLNEVLEAFEEIVNDKVIETQRIKLYNQFLENLNNNQRAKLCLKKKKFKDANLEDEFKLKMFSEVIDYATGYLLDIDKAIDWYLDDLEKKAKK